MWMFNKVNILLIEIYMGLNFYMILKEIKWEEDKYNY